MKHYTLFEAYSTYLEACFLFDKNFWGMDTLFNPFSHIWRNISPFEVFVVKEELFEAFSTYLKACFTFEEGFGVRTLCSGHFLHIWRKELCTRGCHVALLIWSNHQMNNKSMFEKDLIK